MIPDISPAPQCLNFPRSRPGTFSFRQPLPPLFQNLAASKKPTSPIRRQAKEAILMTFSMGKTHLQRPVTFILTSCFSRVLGVSFVEG